MEQSLCISDGLSFDSSMPSDELDVILNDFELSKDELTRECNLTLLMMAQRSPYYLMLVSGVKFFKWSMGRKLVET